jgi:ubiquinone/menaquinone biosynthesis C-methylase UbiE
VSSSKDEAVKRYYNDKSRTYDDYSKQFWSKIYDAVTWKITEPYVPTDAGALVLDAAGGTGKWTIPIAKCGPRVVLGDISRGMLKVAEEKIAQQGLQDRVEVRECDVRRLDFEDESFDLVFCDHALCFIKEQETVVKELVRVLKKSHRLVLTGQNRYVLSLSMVSEDADYAYKVLSKETPFIMRDSLEVYSLSPQEFKQMLEHNGVRIERIAGKLFTVPLGLSWGDVTSEKCSEKLFDKIMRIELELTDRSDAVALGSHFQAIGRRRGS